MHAANQRHTTCSVRKHGAKNLVKRVEEVHYRFHPLYGHEVEVIFSSKRAGENVYLISFIDNTNVYLPAWMTDPLICQNHVVTKEPFCSLSALIQLREFLDLL